MKPRPPRSMVLPRMVVTGPGVIEQLPAVIAELHLPERGLLVCDAVTRSVAGDRVLGYLEEAGHPVAVIEIDGASMEELARVEAAAEGCGFLAGVGGGRPVDLAKQAGYHLDLPFISVPTAASHDGFASARASIRAAGQKTSMEARPPIAVVADTTIIASAPHRLLAAGIGDIVSNQTAVLDWQLGRDRGEEYSAKSSQSQWPIVWREASVPLLLRRYGESTVRAFRPPSARAGAGRFQRRCELPLPAGRRSRHPVLQPTRPAREIGRAHV